LAAREELLRIAEHLSEAELEALLEALPGVVR
jgi:hypothetical protein